MQQDETTHCIIVDSFAASEARRSPPERIRQQHIGNAGRKLRNFGHVDLFQPVA